MSNKETIEAWRDIISNISKQRVKYFKCIKSFTVEPVDDDGFFLDAEPPVTILKDTVWEVRYTNGKPTWIAYQVDGYGRLMDMQKEHWEDTEYFEEVEG